MPTNPPQALLELIGTLPQHRHQTANIIDTIPKHRTTQHLQKRHHKRLKLIPRNNIPEAHSRQHRRPPIPPIQIQVEFVLMVEAALICPGEHAEFLLLFADEVEQ